MRTLRIWIVLSWIALPTVMYGPFMTTAGDALLAIAVGILVYGLVTTH